MAACRCPVPVGHEVGCPLNVARCAGCGHTLNRHRLYANNGRNRHGSPLVCTVDNCAWMECRRKDEPAPTGGVTR
jgi:hypothetical protein